jgi:hypothetical protein
LLTTMPRLPDAGCFWHSKAVPARSRQLPAIMFPRRVGRTIYHVAELTKDMADRDNLHWPAKLEAGSFMC